ncbi:MAG TPA: NAD-dependent epimerase/dehydratase family protein [Bryobacteraceae bacterium]|jgi:nucleoside-diphosphate-sugar epimerase
MRVMVIGGTGHIGSYLVPRLVEAGHAVTNVSRSQRQPYTTSAAWQKVEQLTLDRASEESVGHFGKRLLEAKPDAVVDLTCYTLDSARQLVEALRGRVSHLLHCGTIWVHGVSVEVPTTEEQARAPFGEYGCRKAEIEEYLLAEARRNGLPVTILHPGHLVGKGWAPLNPLGNFNTKVFTDLAQGNEIGLPNLGRECVHHVHADDVSQAFVKSIANWSSAVGESFHVVSPAALTLYGYAHGVASWFGREAQLKFLPWEEWKQTVTEKEAEITWGHIARSPNCSIEKAKRLIGYQPRYRSLEAIREAVEHLILKRLLDL